VSNWRPMIHATAIVDEGANLAPDVEVGPYAVIERGVTVGAGSVIAAHAVLRSGSVLEERVRVDSFAVVGGLPQDLSFDPIVESGVRIGRETTIREHVTVHRSTRPGGFTQVGPNCFLMATCHVGHDCVVEERVVIANAVLLAGHVHVGAYCFLGGSAAVHQFERIGQGVMVGGGTRLSLDAPPFCMVAERNHLVGLNLVGLKRRGCAREAVMELKDCYRAVYSESIGNRRKLARSRLEAGVKHEPGRLFLEFFLGGKRGFVAPEGDGEGGEA